MQNSSGQRNRYYLIARASATECAAVLDCCLALKLIDSEFISECRILSYRIVQMLSRLAGTRNVSNSNRSTHSGKRETDE